MTRKNEAGQTLISTAIMLTVLLGFAGLAIDLGVLRYERRLQQTAADAAAVAGAADLTPGGWTTAGQNASAANGFTNGVNNVTVTMNNPPTSGPHATGPNSTKYVETIVSAVQPLYFMKIFGISNPTISARAVATNVSGGVNSSCLYTLGAPTSAIVGIDATGNAKIIAPNCGISDNGNLDTTGNSYTVEASTVSVSGQCLGSHCGSPDVKCTAYPDGTCPQIGGAPASQDPLKGLVPPSQPAYSTSCPKVPPAGTCDFVSAVSSSFTLQPGTYNSITIGKNSTVTMAPGIYYINGPITVGGKTSSAGMNFNGGGTLTDLANPGVMIYFTNGSSINKAVGGGNNPDIELDPMTTAENATYAGILFFQDPADTTTPYFGGDNNSTYNGTIYMPTATITVYGNGHETFNGTVIGFSVATVGNPTVTFGVSPSGVPIPALLTQPILVE